MPVTQRSEYTFTVKEYGDGTPFIGAEPSGKQGVEVLKDKFLALDLKNGATIKDAEDVSNYLNSNIASVSVTIF